MTPRAVKPSVAAVRSTGPSTASTALPPRLTLRATARGCALIGPHGEIVFQADGVAARRECLKFARERGVLALSS